MRQPSKSLSGRTRPRVSTEAGPARFQASRRGWLLFLAAALLAGACSLPSATLARLGLAAQLTPSPSPSPFPAIPAPRDGVVLPAPSQTHLPTPFPSPTPTLPAPTPAYQPVFEPGPCAFAVPEGTSPTAGPSCGFLVVPENRSRAGSAPVRLAAAIFHTPAEDPAPDPVVYLAGGPGSSALDAAGYLFRRGLGAILDRRDFILFDQRGTGYSQPRLDCPEREALTPDLLAGTYAKDAASQAIVEAFQRCHDRLAGAGIDLSAYSSAASAADLDDLRRALGYPQVNLYGVSYGTRLALTAMRDRPEAIRSVVLDSTYPLEVNLYTSLAPNAERAFNVLFDRCAADPGCSSAYPDLRDVFYNLVDQLNANPAAVTLTAGGAVRTVKLDGELLVDLLFGGLYNPLVIATMPGMIFDIQRGDYASAVLRERLGLYFETQAALGMQMAVQCSEEIPFSRPEEAITASAGVQPQIAAFFPLSVQPLFAACPSWNSSPPDPRENQPVASSLPALVLAGEYDPITPPVWGQTTAEKLTRGYFYEFPGSGHWVTRSSRCALQMALAFWEDPASPPEAGCIQAETGIHFAVR